MVLSSEEKLNSNCVRHKKKRVRKRSLSPKGTLTTPPPNPERTDGVTLPSSDTSFSSKVTQNSDIIQTNPKQSVKRVFRPSYPDPAPLHSTHQYHTRMHRPLRPRQQGQKIPPSQEARANLVLMLPQAVLFGTLTVALQTPRESPPTLQRYEKIPKVQNPWRTRKRKATQLSTSKNDWPN